ncbi:uncharacterized protein TNCV_4133141 [Trichonephila clavipes]|uniref:Uncharacterized protein n=1 Tax=Trichonephila clavipes TaxID=2585209 RepID=A0A8X6V7G9_TRICX|nr:uncharacterized protein TNCV_4133141 [Trichonephila clavipes]
MEVKAAEILWKRSIKNCGMRYVSILSDGDAKTYQRLSSLNVYGNCIKLRKKNALTMWQKGLAQDSIKLQNIVKCPTGSTSWCFYQRALAKNENPMSYSLMKTRLSEQVLEKKILPVYQRLVNDEFLERCSAGKTQNANESIHSVIWKNCPKETFVSKKRLEMGVISAIGGYNFGCFNSLAIEHNELSSVSVDISHKRDKRRLAQSEKRILVIGERKE